MRRLNPYEINQLIKFGFDPIKISNDIQDEIPVEYITEKVEFKNLIFSINKDVLIPRFETEKLIDLGIESLNLNKFKKSQIKFCDIGTGSGCIGISFAKELNNLKVDYECILSDLSDKALEVCTKNLKDIIGKRSDIKLIKSDLFENYPEDTKAKFDIIFANLPYIPSERVNKLQPSVKDFEPKIALDGGKDGLKYIRKLINDAKYYLKKQASLFIEVDDSHIYSKEFKNDYEIDIIKDENLKNRYWKLQLI